jgi:hypothetical protein
MLGHIEMRSPSGVSEVLTPRPMNCETFFACPSVPTSKDALLSGYRFIAIHSSPTAGPTGMSPG